MSFRTFRNPTNVRNLLQALDFYQTEIIGTCQNVQTSIGTVRDPSGLLIGKMFEL